MRRARSRTRPMECVHLLSPRDFRRVHESSLFSAHRGAPRALRHHRRHVCFNKISYKFTRTYLIPPSLHGRQWRRRRVGPFLRYGRELSDQGTGGASQSWFLRIYHERGIDFDRILAWEAGNMTAERILASFPPEVMDRLTYYNMPVESKQDGRFNPWRTLKEIAVLKTSSS